MADSFKEKIYDKVLDEVLDLVIGKSKDEIMEVLFKDTNIKTLYKVMKKFSESDHFKYGFREYIFLKDYEYMSSFNEKDFELTNGFKEIKLKIEKVVKIFFNSDNKDKIEDLTQIITEEYISKASLKINMGDFLIKQEVVSTKIINIVDNQTQLIKDIKKQMDDKERYKSKLIKNELREILIQELNYISNRYCHYVLKQSAKLDHTLNFYKAVKEVVDMVETTVDEDFFRKPVKMIEISQSNIVYSFLNSGKTFDTIIEYKDFTYNYFKKPIIKKIDYINNQYSNQLTEEFTKNMINLKTKMDKGYICTGLEFGINIDIDNASFNLSELRDFLKSIGQIILELYKEIEE